MCNTTVTPSDALQGKIALIQRGTCSFEIKINNAETLGAVGVLVYNNAAGGNTYLSMATGTATLPAGFMTHDDGVTLKAFDGTEVTVGPDSSVSSYPFGLPDTVASFSSRGPRGYDSKLKPEITAPGVAIFAALMGSTNQGVSFDGTSMASPHVAGTAALVRQAHPDWTVEEVKAAIMGTAVDLNPTDADGYRNVPRTGAGRVDAYNSVFTDGLAIGDPELVSLSYGVIEVGSSSSSYIVPDAKQIRLENKSGVSKTYNVSVEFSDTVNMVGATFGVPAQVTVAANSTIAVPVSLTLDPTQLPLNFDANQEEYYGFITFTSTPGPIAPGAPPVQRLRVPFYFVPRPYTTLTKQPGSVTDMSYTGAPGASITYAQTGPQASSLGVWPVTVSMPNDPAVDDMGELRMAGLDYLGKIGGVDYMGFAIANWGMVHDPQTYFNENDLYVDLNQDGNADYVFFNYNYSRYSGAADSNNVWIILRVNLATNAVSLASGYTIYTDFNAGAQEWEIPAANLGVNAINSAFDYQFVAYDENGAEQVTPGGSFDYMKSPYSYDITSLSPLNTATTLTASVNSMQGVMIAKPLGLMVFDYNGKPGFGQAYYVGLTVSDAPVIYLPMVSK